MRNRTLSVVALVISVASGAASAQQPTPPPPSADGAAPVAHARKAPPAKSTGPTLDFTMEYIQDKLINRGLLNYVVAVHADAAGNDWSYEFSDKMSGIYTNVSTCQIGFHWKQTRSGKAVTDKEMFFDLVGSPTIDVLPMEQYLAESTAKGPHPTWTTQVTPAMFVLRISKSGSPDNNLLFPDEDLAGHIAKAMTHAAELCAPVQAAGAPADKKEPF
ncbi:MAG TPA: hypothetical protein VF848_06575 [Steroidobacteraceae bacterium]